jgi:hypothetical protein
VSIALIDNSTLSSVQRVLGEIEVNNRDTIDGDLAAFESLLLAILFYNNFISIDDYKPEYSENRKKHFSFIKFINPNDFELSLVKEKAKNEANNIKPTIQNGEFADETYKSFFELLKVNIKCTWDITSSIYYLTLKMLGEQNSFQFEKYSKICHLIFNELGEINNSGEKRNYNKILLDRKGNEINEGYKIPGAKWTDGTTGGLTGALAVFIASLNWISYRSIYYTYLAEYFEAETFLHPIRQNFHVYYMGKSNRFDINFTSELLKKYEDFALEEVESIIASTKNYAVTLHIPLFLGYIISKTRNLQEIINFAFDLRDKKEFVQARSDFGEIRNIISEQGFSPKYFREVNILFENIKEGFNSIRRNYGISTIQGDLTSSIINSINSLSGKLAFPQIPEKIKDTRIANVISDWKSRKSFGFLYKNLSKELLNISKLGIYYDGLVKNVKENHELAAYSPKSEDPIYKDYHSQWKSPMA